MPRQVQSHTPSTARHQSNACGSVVGRPILILFFTGYQPPWLAELPEEDRGAAQQAFAWAIVVRCDDFSSKPCYDALVDLIHRRLATAVDAATDARGRVEFHGFPGRYEVAVEAGGRRQRATFDLAPGGGVARIVVGRRDAGLENAHGEIRSPPQTSLQRQ